MKILEEYLPKQVSGEELSALIGEVLAETGATTKKEMGRVMGALTQKTGGNARLVFALSVQPTAAMGPGSRAAALVVFPPLLTAKAVRPPRRRRRGRFR